MKPAFEYKDYMGSAEVSIEDNLLFGKLLFIKDVISYAAATPAELEHAFREAVDDYLETCAEYGDQPDTPCKGTFNVRIGPERHKGAALAALHQGISLNEWISSAVDEKLMAARAKSVTNHVTVHYHVEAGTTEHRIISAGQPVSGWKYAMSTGKASVQH
jgi:predicted HicB family RNase H-like nuclease